MLQRNQEAPDFQAETISGNPFQLSQLRGNKVLLKFHRFSGCPVCRNQLDNFIDQLEKIKSAGIELVVLMHSSKEKILPNFSEQEEIYIISDPEKKIYQLYNSQFLTTKLFSINSWKHTFRAFSKGYFPQINRFGGGINGVPSDFLIDEAGFIFELHYGQHFGDSWTPENVLTITRSV